MTQAIYRYRFAEKVPSGNSRDARAGPDGCGEPARPRAAADGRALPFRQGAPHVRNRHRDAGGRRLAKIFTGYATREFGNGAVAIETETTTGQGAGHCPCRLGDGGGVMSSKMTTTYRCGRSFATAARRASGAT